MKVKSFFTVPDRVISLDGFVSSDTVAVLNNGLRPFLSRWHPLLQEWEAQKGDGVSPAAHEKAWDREPALRAELEALRKDLEQYANALAEIAGVND